MRLSPITLSPPDDRDYTRGFVDRLVAAIALPTQVELSVAEVEDQRQHGSCLANAVCSALEIHANRQGIPADYSRMYAYWWIRALSKRHGLDSGGVPRDMCKAVARFGVCAESLYPYDASHLYGVPTEAAIIEGIGNAGWEYERIPTPGIYDGVPEFTACNTAIKSYLAQGVPVLATIEVDDDFSAMCSGAWRSQNWHVRYNRTAKPMGLHEVLIVGYDDAPECKRFKVLNSWGSQWGDGGFFGLMYQPRRGRIWQDRCIKELWVVKPK